MRLAVYNWTFFAEAHMASLSTFVFSTVQHFGTIKFARVVGQDGRVSMLATNLITEMIPAASLSFTN